MIKFNNVMVDLETLGTDSNAAILSIGAVAFSESGEIGDNFQVNIQIDSCLKSGLSISGATLDWWLKQKPEVLRQAIEHAVPLNHALLAFSDWCKIREIKYFWGNSPVFDLVLLASGYKSVGAPVPWDYWNERCYRTVMALYPKCKTYKPKVAHNPISDCEAQILNLSAFFKLRDGLPKLTLVETKDKQAPVNAENKSQFVSDVDVYTMVDRESDKLGF